MPVAVAAVAVAAEEAGDSAAVAVHAWEEADLAAEGCRAPPVRTAGRRRLAVPQLGHRAACHGRQAGSRGRREAGPDRAALALVAADPAVSVRGAASPVDPRRD